MQIVKWPLAVAALVAPSIYAPAVHAADGAQTYTIQAGDTCVSVVKQFYKDQKKGLALFHGNNQLGPQPHKLKPGQVVTLPPENPAPVATVPGVDAQLTFVRNQVLSFTPGQHDGKKDEPLQRGNKVSTLDASSAEVTFSQDQSRLQLGEHTLVIILGGAGATSTSPLGPTTLLNGTLRAHLADLAGPSKKPLSILTPGAEVSAQNGEVQVNVDGKKATRLSVFKGKSQVRAAKADVAVPEGYGTKTDLGKPPAKPHLLPRPPVWGAPFPTPYLETAALDRPLSLRWDAPVPSTAVKWHLQIARDQVFNDLVLDVQTEASKPSYENPPPPLGLYYVRVSGIDSDGLEGKSCDMQAMAVAALDAKEGAVGLPTAVTLPPGAACTVDGQPSGDTSLLNVLRDRTHLVRCEAPSQKPLDLELAPMLTVSRATVQVLQVGSDGRTDRIVIQVLAQGPDGARAPHATMSIRIPDVTDPVRLRETETPGAYEGRTAIRSHVQPVQAKLEVERGPTLDVVIPPTQATP